MVDELALVAVRVRGLVKEYAVGAPPALRGIDLDIDRGRFVSVMGPSGSGKSTLLHLIGGLDRASGGSVTLGESVITDLDDRTLTELRRTQIGFVFQSFNLVPVLTVSENVALPAVIAKRSEASYSQRLGELLELVGLSGHRDKLPAQLSGGEQQRVAIARALLLEPPLLLADEPTGNLDSVTGASVLSLVCAAADELGTTVLMVTHDSGAAAHADTVVFLKDGAVSGRLDLPDVSHEERVAQVHRMLAADGAVPKPVRRRRPPVAPAEV